MAFMMPQPMDIYSMNAKPKKKKRMGMAPDMDGTALAPEGSMADEASVLTPGQAPRKRKRMQNAY